MLSRSENCCGTIPASSHTFLQSLQCMPHLEPCKHTSAQIVCNTDAEGVHTSLFSAVCSDLNFDIIPHNVCMLANPCLNYRMILTFSWMSQLLACLPPLLTEQLPSSFQQPQGRPLQAQRHTAFSLGCQLLQAQGRHQVPLQGLPK